MMQSMCTLLYAYALYLLLFEQVHGLEERMELVYTDNLLL